MSTLKFAPETIETIAIADIKPYERNPRTHSDDQVGKIAASMMEFGWTVPIMIDDNNEIIAGHGRVMAAQRLGVQSVPAIRLRHLSPEQVAALRIADNQITILGDWDMPLLSGEIHALNAADFDLGMLGFTDEQLLAFTSPLPDDNTDGSGNGSLSDRFGIPPFSVFNAREGWWQDRKRAWVDMGIQSELGRGEMASDPNMSRTAAMDIAAEPQQRYKANATPGGHLMPACNYSKSGKRGDSKGREID